MSAESQPSTASPTAAPYPTPRIAWYVVAVLMLFYVFSFIDRQIISLLVEPIKRDLHMPDTQIGLLQGLAFAILYTFLGIPIGRLADRFSRRSIIAAGVLIWSIAATYCGMAKSVFQLFLGRIGVGVGEATLSPAAYSMMTDLFPREKQGGAFSVYNMGITIGSGLALLIGGLVVVAVSGESKTFVLPILGEVRAWQMAFIVAGLPGVLLPLLLLSVREPVRRGLIQVTNAAGNLVTHRPSIWEVVLFIVKNRSFYLKHFFAYALLSMVGYGSGAWLPTVLHRTYGVKPGQVGIMLGILLLVISTPSVFAAGKLCDWFARRGRRDAPVLVCLISAVGIAVLSVLPLVMPNIPLMWVALALSLTTFHGYVAMAPLIVNQVTPNQMRAQISSLMLLVVNLLGMGFGPYMVPKITEILFHDEAQIRWGLVITILVGGLSAAGLLLWERAEYKQKIADAAAWQ